LLTALHGARWEAGSWFSRMTAAFLLGRFTLTPDRASNTATPSSPEVRPPPGPGYVPWRPDR